MLHPSSVIKQLDLCLRLRRRSSSRMEASHQSVPEAPRGSALSLSRHPYPPRLVSVAYVLTSFSPTWYRRGIIVNREVRASRPYPRFLSHFLSLYFLPVSHKRKNVCAGLSYPSNCSSVPSTSLATCFMTLLRTLPRRARAVPSEPRGARGEGRSGSVGVRAGHRYRPHALGRWA